MSLSSSFASGFGLSAALIVAIGAQNMFVLRQGLRREHIVPIVMFCALADLALVAAGVAGIGQVLAILPGLAQVLTLGGTAFLLWYGLDALRRAIAPGTLVADAGGGNATLAAVLGRAVAFTFLNPHVYLDTVMLMGAAGGALPGAMRPVFVAGAGTASTTWFVALGFGARLLRPVFARPVAWRILDGLVAATMFALAGLLAARAWAGWH
ncbi:LysE/ArgO family amino acid transporter [Gluconacetobacter tumulisoli]|uniref:LysE family transporter n=1 Tax=Gluconacetobacter tumulisoli TaxID=1286189 RepID=A0A7W4K9T3_9PROT|nr:LysE family transporter [Gluconacetobacter tumulisoli]MBB2202955.1 LysE family transporter [Gluconacetobacter tumulisoli]